MHGTPTTKAKRPPFAVVVALLVVLSVLFDPRVAFDALSHADSAHGQAAESALEQATPTFDVQEPVYPASCLVTVQSDLDIAASAKGDEVETFLRERGFQVSRLANTPSESSIVVYNELRYKTVANRISACMGGVRVLINSGAGYVFEGDVLVVVGSDFADKVLDAKVRV